MLFLAYKNLFQEKIRSLISIIGVTFSVTLMLLLLGMYDGISKQFISYLDHNPSELVVAKKGVRDMYHAVSLIPKDLTEVIEDIKGIKEVQGIIFMRAFYELQDKSKQDMILASYNPKSKIGAPWDLVEGRQVKSINETVVDINFARKNNIEIGDEIKLLGEKFKVVGFSEGISNLLAYYAFIHNKKGEDLIRIPNVDNFLFVDLKDSYSQKRAQKDILNEIGPEIYAVYTMEEFVDSNLQEIEESFLPIVFAMVVIAIFVGTAVIGLTTYSATLDKVKEYGVLKAIGITNRQLNLLVIQQSLISAAIGYILGVVVTFIVGNALEYFIPNINVLITQNNLILVAIFTLIMSILASYIPIRRISRIDPAEVFKS